MAKELVAASVGLADIRNVLGHVRERVVEWGCRGRSHRVVWGASYEVCESDGIAGRWYQTRLRICLE